MTLCYCAVPPPLPVAPARCPPPGRRDLRRRRERPPALPPAPAPPPCSEPLARRFPRQPSGCRHPADPLLEAVLRPPSRSGSRRLVGLCLLASLARPRPRRLRRERTGRCFRPPRPRRARHSPQDDLSLHHGRPSPAPSSPPASRHRRGCPSSTAPKASPQGRPVASRPSGTDTCAAARPSLSRPPSAP